MHPGSVTTDEARDLAAREKVGAMAQEQDIRFCPYCSLMEFNMATVENLVHCELCGVDVPVEELVTAI